MERSLGTRHLGVRGGALAVCVLALLGGSVRGGADDGGSLPPLSPPYAPGHRTETSSMVLPCREIPKGPEEGASSELEIGRITIWTAADAEECTSLAYDAAETWDLGPAPEVLVGMPARLTVVFVPESFHSQGQGDATFGGSVGLSVGGAEEWTLRSFECSAGRCRSGDAEVRGERVVLDGTVRSLPARVPATFRAEAFVRDGTGRARVRLTGRLVSVSFAAAWAGPDAASAGRG